MFFIKFFAAMPWRKYGLKEAIIKEFCSEFTEASMGITSIDITVDGCECVSPMVKLEARNWECFSIGERTLHKRQGCLMGTPERRAS